MSLGVNLRLHDFILIILLILIFTILDDILGRIVFRDYLTSFDITHNLSICSRFNTAHGLLFQIMDNIVDIVYCNVYNILI